MKIAFKIQPSANKNVALHLLIEVGDEDISFLIFSKVPFKIEGLYSLSFEKNIIPTNYINEVKKYIEETTFLQEINYSSTVIFYNFSTAVLVPLQYFVEDKKQEILDQLFVPDTSRICFEETCNDQSIKNIYSVPAVIHNSFVKLYSLCKFAHSTSYQLTNKDAALYCIIYSASIKVIFFKEKELQIVQYFNYTTPADVCYHILNVAERFETTSSEINLILSGMIDVNSTLYKELYKYFLNINFAETQNIIVSEELEELPSHFYHHLTALANAHN